MTAPIGKGSRFLALTGGYRGQEGEIADGPDDAGRYLLTNDHTKWEATSGLLVTADALDGPGFKRLPDAPAAVDPLFAEIDALARVVDMEAIGQAGGVADAIRDSLGDEDDPDDDEDWYAAQRLLLLDIAALALAGVRSIDRRRKP